MNEVGNFWTAEEVAAYLRIPQSTVYKFAQDKILPGFKVGKHWRFRREAILEWIEQRENISKDAGVDSLE
ncbi:MAG: helix-turn-helix domain-containing protein [Planctomycetes bacterium]|nr:helix-turn-helix domain-containing protein [Planctomycetota bacterium]